MPMPTVLEAINELKKYLDDPLTGTYAAYTISRLTTLTTLTDEAVTSLANQLNNWIDNDSLGLKTVSRNGVASDTAFYNALLALAAAKPLNDKDFFTQDAITTTDPTCQIVTSERYQFDIVSLAKWIRTAGMIHPVYGTPFKPRDIAIIKQLASSKGISLTAAPESKQPAALNPLSAATIEAMGVPVAYSAAPMQATPPIPLAIQALAISTGISIDYLIACKENESKTDTLYQRITNCQFYLNNHKNKENHHAAMTLEEVLTTSYEQSINLKNNFEHVLERRISKIQAKNLTAEGVATYLATPSPALPPSAAPSLFHHNPSGFFEVKSTPTTTLESKATPPTVEALLGELHRYENSLAMVELILMQHAKSNTATARLILQTPILSDKLFANAHTYKSSPPYILTEIAKSHTDSARFILQNDLLRARLLTGGEASISYNLAEIAKSHADSARFILQNDLLRARLLTCGEASISYNLAEIAKSHADSARFILQDDLLRARLLANQPNHYLTQISQAHSTSAVVQTLCAQYQIDESSSSNCCP